MRLVPTLCIFFWLAVGVVHADLRVKVKLSDQMPPLAHAGQDYSWTFLPTTFSSGKNGAAISYTISGLPKWARFDRKTRTISGKPPKVRGREEVSDVTVTAKADGSTATDSFRMVAINAPAPTLKKPLRDQLPQMASMGKGNMLPHKVLHLPLGWSFSIGFDGDTFVLPEQDRVYYTVKLAEAQPLPDWLKYDPPTYTLEGVAPTEPGPNGAYYQVVVYASNKPNTGGPTDNFTIFVGHGVITPMLSPLPAANVTEGETLQYNISSSDFLLDGKRPPHKEKVAVSLGTNPPEWLSYDQNTHNLTGKAPFNSSRKDMQHYDAPLRLKVGDNQPTELNVSVHVYPSPFTSQKLPNVTLPLGKDFNTPLGKYLRGDDVHANVTFITSMHRRAMRYRNSRPVSVVVRRSAPDWISYDDESQSLRGTTPNSPQQLRVQMVAANTVRNAPVPASTASFIVHVKGGAHNATKPESHDGLSTGGKIAIGVSIGGAFLLAVLLALLWFFCCHRPSRYQTPVEQSSATVPQIQDTQDEPVSTGHGDIGEEHYADATPAPSGGGGGGDGGAAAGGAAGAGVAGAAAAAAGAGAAGLGASSSAGAPPPRAAPPIAEGFAPLRSRITPVPEEMYSAVDNDEPAVWRRVDDDDAPTPFLAPAERMDATWTEPARGTLRDPPMPSRSMDASNVNDRTAETWRDESAVADPGHSGYSVGGVLGGIAAATGLSGFSRAGGEGRAAPLTNLLTMGRGRDARQAEDDGLTEPMVTAEGHTSVDHGLGMQNVFGGSKSNSEHSSSEPDNILPNIMLQHANQAISSDMPQSQSSGLDKSNWEEDIWYPGQAPHERAEAEEREKEAPAPADSDSASSAMHTARGGFTDENAELPAPAPQIELPFSAPPAQAQSYAERGSVSTHPSAASPRVTAPWVHASPPAAAPAPVPPGDVPSAASAVEQAPAAGHARQVMTYQPQLADVPEHRRNVSQIVEPQDVAGMFDDAEHDPVRDPFEGHEYPYGTVLGQPPRSESGAVSVESPLRRSIELEYRETEASIAHFLAGGRVDEDDSGARRFSRGSFAAVPYQRMSGTPATMESLNMAHSRSVAFNMAKPPRLQLASCHPGETIALPLLNSLASVPQNLQDAVQRGGTARYVPQLYAPTRPDLHQTWPSWVSWLSWDNERQELSGTVPREFASEQRLPMQLPIHVLLQHEPDSSTSGALLSSTPESLLVARILLTILRPSAS